MTFASLGITPHLIQSLHANGYDTPTPIQTKVIPIALRGRDVMGAAQTGTGKTAAYALPIIEHLRTKAQSSRPQALILVPTRELATQVASKINGYAQRFELPCLAVFGGANIKPQITALASAVSILVATPGRLLELHKQNALSLLEISHLVLDEADTLLDMGFAHEVETILNLLPPKRQTLLFSATMTGAVKRLGETILNKPMVLEVDNLKAAELTLTQIVHPVDKERKNELLSYLIGSQNLRKVLVFARTKTDADAISLELTQSGLPNIAIHGDKTHGARARALDAFREDKVPILVATDIAARGLDIEGLDVVINYDIPHIGTDYLHRIGRTGRAGKAGVAITLLSSAEHISWQKIEKMLGKKVQTQIIKGFEPTTQIIQSKKNSKSDKKTKIDGAFGNKMRAKKEKQKPKRHDKR